MITNSGKRILGKYLIGQAPAYASHIAVGCGASTVTSTQDLGDYSEYKALEFEMFRAPIISRGYVNEDGIDKVVFTAEIPSQERYQITEVGIYSSGSNPSAPGFDSRTLYSFSRQEPWLDENGNLLQSKDEPLDANNVNNDIDDQGLKVFQTNSTNKLFSNTDRILRGEQPRYLNNIVMARGDLSGVLVTETETIDPSSDYISLTPTFINLDQNAPTDLIKIAFSVINTDGSIADPLVPQPDKVAVMLEFRTPSGAYARLYGSLIGTQASGTVDFSAQRYFYLEKQLNQIEKSGSDFVWSQVNSVRLFSAIVKDGVVSSDFYLGLDAIRLDNVNTVNPLYGLTGYSVIVSPDGLPVVKLPNTSSFIEFRFGVGV